jgi:hypothetical protein
MTMCSFLDDNHDHYYYGDDPSPEPQLEPSPEPDHPITVTGFLAATGTVTTDHAAAVTLGGYTVGDIEAGKYSWQHQTLDFNCAVAAQTDILHQFGKTELTLDHTTNVAFDKHWLSTDGTSPADVGKVLNHFGIPTHSVTNASFQDLARELQSGHRVIVSVKGGDLWNNENDTRSGADHAVVVVGIDFAADPNNPQVIINDSGIENGCSRRYPLRQFMAAWDNGKHFYVATNQSPFEAAFGTQTIAPAAPAHFPSLKPSPYAPTTTNPFMPPASLFNDAYFHTNGAMPGELALFDIGKYLEIQSTLQLELQRQLLEIHARLALPTTLHFPVPGFAAPLPGFANSPFPTGFVAPPPDCTFWTPPPVSPWGGPPVFAPVFTPPPPPWGFI